MNAEPLPVELLASEDSRRLQTATASARPMPASAVEELLAELRRIEAEKSNRENKP